MSVTSVVWVVEAMNYFFLVTITDALPSVAVRINFATTNIGESLKCRSV
jgi:hypothetical protein